MEKLIASQIEEVLELLINESKKYLFDNKKGKIDELDFKNMLFNIAYKYYSGSDYTSITSNLGIGIEEVKEKLSIDETVTWDKGWTFVNSSTTFARMYGEYLVNKGDEFKLVESGNFIETKEIVNDNKLVNLKIEQIEHNNGWYFIRSKIKLTYENLIRIYLTVNNNDGRYFDFLHQLKKNLDNYQVPFEFKFETIATNRYDNIVLYCPQQHYYITFIIIKYLHQSFEDLFRAECPKFTKILLPGVSFAEDPDIRGESFGMNRSILLLDVVYKYFNYSKAFQLLDYGENTLKFEKQILQESVAKKKDKGIVAYSKDLLKNIFYQNWKRRDFDLDDCFFRKPNSYFDYDFSVFSETTTTMNTQRDKNSSEYLEKAYYVGTLLCKYAIVTKSSDDKKSFNWLIANANEDNWSIINYTFINNSFETGKLGILYFLSKLYTYFSKDYLLFFFCKNLLESEFHNDESTFSDEIRCNLGITMKGENQLHETNFEEKNFSYTPIKLKNLMEVFDLLFKRKESFNLEGNTNANHIIENIITYLDKRGVYSFHTDDEFIPNIGDYGYAFIGLALIKKYEDGIEKHTQKPSSL